MRFRDSEKTVHYLHRVNCCYFWFFGWWIWCPSTIVFICVWCQIELAWFSISIFL